MSKNSCLPFVVLLGCLFFTLSNCAEGEPEPEPESVCRGDAECQDGVHCNGWEICDPSHRFADARGCVFGTACEVVRNVVRRDEILYDGIADSPPYRACSEALYGLGIYRDCAYREGNPQPGRNTVLDETVCAEPSKSDYEGSCTTFAAFCSADDDCDDGQFCNGTEICDPESNQADPRGCVVDDGSPCGTGFICDELFDTCTLDCQDRDGDGALDVACGGTDCNDDDSNTYPGAPELCDAIDQDCDPSTIGGADGDGDGFVPYACSNPIAGGVARGTDCDDNNPHIIPASFRCLPNTPNNPGGFEQCIDGVWTPGACPENQICVMQPTLVGVCVPS